MKAYRFKNRLKKLKNKRINFFTDYRTESLMSSLVSEYSDPDAVQGQFEPKNSGGGGFVITECILSILRNGKNTNSI